MIASILYFIDIFGRPVTINFSGREKFKSKFGGVCTLIFLGFLIWAFYDTSQDLFTRSNPSTINSETYTEDPLPLILSSESFPIGIGLQAPASMDLMPFINESIYTVDFVYTKVYKTTAEDGTITDTLESIILDKEICTLANFGDQAANFVNVQINTTYCIARNQSQVNQVQIQGVYSSPVYELILAQVKQCNNLTSVCAEPEVLDEYLSASWFNALYVNMAVNPKNYSHPEVKFREIYSTMISPANYKETTLALGKVDVTTDSGWIVSDLGTKEYINVDTITEVLEFSPGSDGLLFTFNILASNIETQYSRSYKTIPNVLAEVGGLANVALVILLIVTTPYSRLNFFLSLINELFDVHPISQKRKRSKKKNKDSKPTTIITTSLQIEVEKERVNNTNEIQLTKHDYAKEGHAKSIQSSESLFAKNPHFSRLASYVIKPKGVANEKEMSSSSPTYLPISLNSPVSQKGFMTINIPENDDININKTTDNYEIQIKKDNPSTQRNSHDISRDNKELFPYKGQRAQKDSILSIQPRLERSRSSSLKIPDEVQYQVDRKGYSQEMDTLKTTKRDKDKSKRSLIEDRPKMYKVDQKYIDQNDNDGEVSLMSLEDKFSDPGVGNLQSEINNIIPLREDVEKTQEKRNLTLISAEDSPKNLQIDARKIDSLKKSHKIDISFWEYLLSFFYQPESLKEKLDILAEGMKNVEERLDLIGILKKLREIDKIKAILLDSDQAILFNNLPNPEIKPKALRRSPQNVSFTHKLLKKPTFIDKNETMSMVFDSHFRIEEKAKKTKIDQRLIDIFKEKAG